MGGKVALLVGVNDCQSRQPGTHVPLGPLQYAEKDPHLLREKLLALGFHVPDYAVLTGKQATVSRVLGAIKELCRESPWLFVFFFAGHGGTDDDGHQTLCFRTEGNHVGHWSIDDIRREVLAQSVKQFLIIVDACRRTEGRGRNPRGPEVTFRKDGTVFKQISGYGTQSAAFFGSKYGQSCWEDPNLGHGVFTWSLAQTLDKWSPAQDVSLQNLFTKAQSLMATKLRESYQYNQTPFLVPSSSTISLTRLNTYTILPKPDKVAEPVRCLAASRNNYMLLTSGGQLLCSRNGDDWRTLEAGGPVLAAAISQRTADIYCLVRHEQSPRLMLLDHGGQRRFLMRVDPVWSGISLDEGDTLALFGTGVIYFEPGAWGTSLDVPEVSGVRDAVFFKGNLLVAAGERILSCDLELREHEVLRDDSPLPVQHVAASMPGNWAGWSNWSTVYLHSQDRRTNREIPFRVPITSLCFCPNEEFLAIGTSDGYVYLENLIDPQGRIEIIKTEGIVSALSFTSDGNHLLVGTSRGRLTIHPLQSYRQRRAMGATT
ncbi:MAG TPA: caspase family protein [Candidatus Dormibacteraeota bacterium]|jgi:hypothetical protein|nr:caspase family protein [Candidatus Dormibacteraeota bacterium]